MAASRPSFLISDLYDAGLQTAAEIKLRLAHLRVKPAESRYAEQNYNDWIKTHALPHQSLDFGRDVSHGLDAAARAFAQDLDRAVDLDIARVAGRTTLADTSADQTITAAMQKANPPGLLAGLGNLFGQSARHENNRQGAANDLAAYEIQMRHTLRTLKAAMTGTEPDERFGYKTYPLATLYADQIPTSQEGWSELTDNTFKALQPQPIDSLVVDNQLTGQSWGLSMLRWGDNDYGQAEQPSYSLRSRYAYSRSQVHFENFAQAQGAFNQILNAEDASAIDRALHKDDTGNAGPVKVRHTSEGNFIGGALANDVHHPNADVRARARTAQAAAGRLSAYTA